MSTWTGKRIRPLSPRMMMGTKRGNEIIEAVNALLNATLRAGNKDDVIISDANSVYQYRGQENGGTGFGLLQCKVTTVNGAVDYVSVKQWNGSAYTSDEFDVAKSLLSRCPASEVIDTITLDYTYSDDNNRVSSDGTNTEDQVVYPRYAVGSLLWVISADYTSITVGGTELTWIEVHPQRLWVRKYLQE